MDHKDRYVIINLVAFFDVALILTPPKSKSNTKPKKFLGKLKNF